MSDRPGVTTPLNPAICDRTKFDPIDSVDAAGPPDALVLRANTPRARRPD
jgi:hypothetical protein